MKRIIVFAVLLLVSGVSVVSCTRVSAPENEVEVAEEMSLTALARLNAKGYVSGLDFYEVVNPSGSETPTPRKMQVSAWNSTQEKDYFIGKEFSRGSDGKWHGDPKVYYPLGCSVELLAYSTTNKVTADWNTAKYVKLAVDEKCFQDDVLYGKAAASSMAPEPNMVFHHSQAWIMVKLKANIDDKVKVDGITWENVYDKGELRVSFENEADASTPQAEWEFFTQDLKNVDMDDPFAVLSSNLTTSDKVLNMLLPEQNHGTFVLTYTLAGKQFKYRIPEASLSSTTWDRGKKYVYTVEFTLSRITIAPEVKIYVNETINIEL